MFVFFWGGGGWEGEEEEDNNVYDIGCHLISMVLSMTYFFLEGEVKS